MKKIVLIMMVVFLSACSNKDESDSISVVTSFFPYYNMTSLLVDDTTTLTNIMPLNMEVHDYEPSPKDIALLEDADLLIVHGAGIEDWLEPVLQSIRNDKLRVIRVSDIIEMNLDDPHTWLNPSNGLRQFEMIKDALKEVNPASSDHYDEQFDHYLPEFNELINSFDALENYRGKTIIVDHLAYSHMLKPFGIHQRSVLGGYNADEASAKHIEEIIDFIKTNQIHTIFNTQYAQTTINDVIIKETGVNTLELSTLEMSGDSSASYLSLMQGNLIALLKGLK